MARRLFHYREIDPLGLIKKGVDKLSMKRGGDVIKKKENKTPRKKHPYGGDRLEGKRTLWRLAENPIWNQSWEGEKTLGKWGTNKTQLGH